jgi:hypothetical protein
MPGWLAAVARVNPLSLTVDAWRGALLLGQTPSAFTVTLLALLAAALFLLALGGMRAAARLY